MPPLREHPEDIPAIASAIVERLASSASQKTGGPSLAPDALAALVTQPWPGNVRELQNALEKGLARSLAAGRSPCRIEALDLGLEAHRSLLEMPFREGRALAAEEWSRRAVTAALASTGGNVTRAAELLQMNTSALFRLIKRYRLDAQKP